MDFLLCPHASGKVCTRSKTLLDSVYGNIKHHQCVQTDVTEIFLIFTASA